jgi:hypothetical protein
MVGLLWRRRHAEAREGADPHTRQAAIRALVEDVVVPLIEELSSDVRKRLSTRIRIGAGDEAQTFQRIVGHARLRETAEGEIRMILEERARAIAFSGEAAFFDLGPTGLSGFSVRGTIDPAADPPKVRTLVRTLRYNIWNWDPKFY